MSVYKIFIEYEATPLMNCKYLIIMEIYAFNCNVKTNCMIDLIFHDNGEPYSDVLGYSTALKVS